MKFFKRLEFKKDEVLDSTEEYEAVWYDILRVLAERLIKGLYVFITRKGEVHGASATFFTLLTFAPLILLIITLHSMIIGNSSIAYNEVMAAIKLSFPELAPWIYKSIQKIIQAQMSSNGHNWINTLILIYSTLGLSNAMVFGVTTLSGEKLRGGWLIENIKALFATVVISFFIIGSVILSLESQDILVNIFGRGEVFKLIHLMFTNGIIQAILFMLIFTIFYMYITPLKIRVSDGILGAASVAILFFLFKSFYKFYIEYNKEAFIQSFGNFYTIIIAVLFIYFIYCAFYFGAAVAYAPAQLVRKKKKASTLPNIPIPDEELKEHSEV